MEIDSNKFKEYALFHINRKIINLYKQFLFILEDLRDEKFPIEDPRIYQATRKRVLDLGNDAIREISEMMEQLEVNIRTDTK